MEKEIASKNQSKRDLYYEEAQSLFITGMKLSNIVNIIPVTRRTLSSWKRLGQWQRKRELVTEHPRLIGEALRGLVKQKVKSLLDNKEDINLSTVDELNKIISLIDRLQEQCWDERAAIVEVMGRFGDFARRQVGEKKELQMLARLMEKFFEEMEEP